MAEMVLEQYQMYEKIAIALKEKPKRMALYRAMKRGRDSRHTAIGALPGGEEFRKEVRQIKLRCIEEQEVLVERFAGNDEYTIGWVTTAT